MGRNLGLREVSLGAASALSDNARLEATLELLAVKPRIAGDQQYRIITCGRAWAVRCCEPIWAASWPSP